MNTKLYLRKKIDLRSRREYGPRLRQVTSPQKSLNARHSYTECPITMKLSAINIRISIYKILSWNFHIGDSRSGQFCDPSIWYKPMGEKWKRLFWTKSMRNTFKHQVTGRLDTLNQTIATSDPSPCCQGHFRSWKVTGSFSAITFDRAQLEQWKHHRCVQADNTDRLICNMTFLDLAMTLT